MKGEDEGATRMMFGGLRKAVDVVQKMGFQSWEQRQVRIRALACESIGTEMERNVYIHSCIKG